MAFDTSSQSGIFDGLGNCNSVAYLVASGLGALGDARESALVGDSTGAACCLCVFLFNGIGARFSVKRALLNFGTWIFDGVVLGDNVVHCLTIPRAR